MGQRIHNFNAGPAVLPEEVLREVQEAVWEYGGSGMGVMELSHRGKHFEALIREAEADLRAIAGIPDHYRVLFLQGGASLQFSMIPMNLLPAEGTADYLITGAWSQKAAAEARLFGGVHEAASTAGENFRRLPAPEEIRYSEAPAYVHLTTNNTIFGTQWPTLPAVPAGVPLVADASSDLLSRPIDINAYGVIYAGAQKNLGASGVTLVIIRDDLAERRVRPVPTMLRYSTHAKEGSLYNTPPSLSVLVVSRVLKWILREGGLEAIARRNEEKAGLIYAALEASPAFSIVPDAGSRSLMNVCFRAATPEIEAEFLARASHEGFAGLKGHRSVGGMRASLYNACPPASCRALAEFIRAF